jgi:hypothetical protein
MSSVSLHQQHLTSVDMDMIMRVHDRVCVRNAIMPGSLDAERLAVLLVREFQHGVNEEADLLAAFPRAGPLKLSIPMGKMDKFIGNAVGDWDADGETAFEAAA